MKLYEFIRLLNLSDENLKNTLEIYFIGPEIDDFVDIPITAQSLMRFADAEVTNVDLDSKDGQPIMCIGLSTKPIDFLDYNFLRDPNHSYHRG